MLTHLQSTSIATVPLPSHFALMLVLTPDIVELTGSSTLLVCYSLWSTHLIFGQI